MSTTVACKLVWSAGSATFTTVLSMKARLDPRMVAASTQRLAAAVHGTPPFADLTTASSQGALMQALDASAREFDSDLCPSTNSCTFRELKSIFLFMLVRQHET